ncbi:Rv2231c family pyridoxal phosphate-dependent protein CobC [Streptomyces sp. NPDC001941]|uniref:Rv2231c family pyridoxal phosphate-dependent protein CobC n=1 Tax=Streptomyces sp. NPDC001941 TaxID=3154659 RepID=UPI003333DF0F
MSTLVVGVGARRGVSAEEVLELVGEALREAGPRPGEGVELATAAAKAAEPGIVAAAARLGVPLRAHPPEELAAVTVPDPSERVLRAAGTASVAEAAALVRGGVLLVPKRRSAWAGATCAVARLDDDRAGAGPGPADARGPAAAPGEGPGGDGARSRGSSGGSPCGEAGGREPGGGGRLLAEGPGYTAGEAPFAPLTGSPAPSTPHASPPVPHGSPPPSAPHAPSTPHFTHTTAAMHTHPDVHDPAPHDLRHHGDAEVRDEKLTDLAVNVRANTPPDWLRERIADSLTGLAAYPDGRTARAAVAERHGLPADRVLLTAGAAEAFVLLARALPVRRPVVVHPQFTEPESALRDAGHEVERVLLREADGFRLDPAAVPEDADLVVVGNPTNPTSVLHPAGTIASLARPGRTLVVDEAFIDAVPGERESLAGRTDVPGLVVLRSLTKTWGLAGLRIGYVLGHPETIALLGRAQPLWPVSTPALAAAEACMTRAALAEAEHAAYRIGVERDHLLAGLAEFEEVRAVDSAQGPFVLIRVERADVVRERLRALGFAARRGDTFPGLDRDWLRLAVRDRATTNRFLQALDQALVASGYATR